MGAGEGPGPIGNRSDTFIGELDLIVCNQCDNVDVEHGADLIQIVKTSLWHEVGRRNNLDGIDKLQGFKTPADLFQQVYFFTFSQPISPVLGNQTG